MAEARRFQLKKGMEKTVAVKTVEPVKAEGATVEGKVQFGEPVEELPGGVRNGSAMWDQVVEHVRSKAGKFVPVQIPDMTVKTLQGLPSRIKTGRLLAFRNNGKWDAAIRNGVLYVKFEG